jgi:hypothetical protein
MLWFATSASGSWEAPSLADRRISACQFGIEAGAGNRSFRYRFGVRHRRAEGVEQRSSNGLVLLQDIGPVKFATAAEVAVGTMSQ